MPSKIQWTWFQRILLSRTRFFLISGTLCSLLTLLSAKTIVFSAYDSYWNSIDRVQTVDFNIMAATTTGTASQIIKTSDNEKAQEFVNANFCLFRVQLESCHDENCSVTSVIADNANGEFSRCGNLSKLIEDPLRIPVFSNELSMATIQFEHAYQENPIRYDLEQIPIGFITVHRIKRPSFDSDFRSFIGMWINGQANASRHSVYKTSTYIGILIGLVVFALLMIGRQKYIANLKRNMLTKKLTQAISSRFKNNEKNSNG